MSEGNLALAETPVYLATTPKSNSSIRHSQVQEEIKHGSTESVPLHLQNPVTALMKDMGYGKGYKSPLPI
ncbi:hypothetical protein M1N59_00625 [Dehalococcoidales bacterium]|nr:hypothetical protein [Dehalococcoidales bacterium]